MRIIEFIHDTDHPIKPSNIDHWIKGRQHDSTARHNVFENKEFPSLNDFDLLIVHGGTQHLWNKDAAPWLYREIEYVRMALKSGKPVIGFCLGSQIIAEALGGSVYKGDIGEFGFYNVTTTQGAAEHILLKDLAPGFGTFLFHSDHYTLPPDCESLAYTQASPNQVIAAKNSPAIGFQFHPEYTKKIIADCVRDYPEPRWQTDTGNADIESFIKNLEARPATIELFDKLMHNSLAYFKERFG